MGHRVERWGAKSPVEAKSHAWNLVVDVDPVGAAVVDDDSWVPVAVELVVLVEDLLDLFHDASAVVGPKNHRQLLLHPQDQHPLQGPMHETLPQLETLRP